jgi:hypothetical protein
LALRPKFFGLGLESQVLNFDLASSGLGLDIVGLVNMTGNLQFSLYAFYGEPPQLHLMGIE